MSATFLAEYLAHVFEACYGYCLTLASKMAVGISSSSGCVNLLLLAQVLVEGHDGKTAPIE